MKRHVANTRGYIMLDLLIVSSITVLLLSLCSIWIYHAMRYSTKVHDRDVHFRSVQRVGMELREIVRSSSGIELSGGVMSLTDSAGGETRFEIDGNWLRGSTINGQSVVRNDFEFAPNARLTFNGDELPGWVTLEIRRDFSQLTVAKKMDSDQRLDAAIRVGPRRSVRVGVEPKQSTKQSTKQSIQQNTKEPANE